MDAARVHARPLLAGKLVDRMGVRRALVVGRALFTAARAAGNGRRLRRPASFTAIGVLFLALVALMAVIAGTLVRPMFRFSRSKRYQADATVARQLLDAVQRFVRTR